MLEASTLDGSEIDPSSLGTLFERRLDFHERWSLRLGTSLEDRPRYTPNTTFETFPFPVAVMPNVPAPNYATRAALYPIRPPRPACGSAGPPLRGRAAPILPLLTPCQVGRLACTHSRPIRPRSGLDVTRSERRLRRRGGRRPRPDLELRSGLHPEAVKTDGHGMGGEPLPLRRRTRPA